MSRDTAIGVAVVLFTFLFMVGVVAYAITNDIAVGSQCEQAGGHRSAQDYSLCITDDGRVIEVHGWP